MDNDGYGLNNQDASVTIDAQENWWGDPAGPGTRVHGLADTANWFTAPVDVLAEVDRAQVAAAVGSRAYNTLNLTNLAVMSDTLRISLTSSLPWPVAPAMPATLTLQEDAWSTLPLTITIPADVTPGTTNTITLTIQSMAHPEQMDAASFQVAAWHGIYLPVMLH